jgi:hypothetical protein
MIELIARQAKPFRLWLFFAHARALAFEGNDVLPLQSFHIVKEIIYNASQNNPNLLRPFCQGA